MKLRRRWKVFWNLAVIFAIIVVARRWDPPFDDSDMRFTLTQVEVPPDQNAYPDYARICLELRIWSQGKRLLDGDLRGVVCSNWPNGNEKALHAAEVLDQMERIVEKTGFQPPSTPDGTKRLHDDILFTSPRDMICLYGLVALSENRPDEAARAAKVGLRLAQYFDRARMNPDFKTQSDSYVYYLVAALANHPGIKREVLRPILDRLCEISVPPDNFRRDLPCYYQLEASRIESLRHNGMASGSYFRNRWSPPLLADPVRCPRLSSATHWLIDHVSFLPNQTKKRVYVEVRSLFPRIGLPVNHPDFDEHWLTISKLNTPSNDERRFLRPNFVGESIAPAGEITRDYIFWCLVQNEASIAHTSVALRLHHMEHGGYPRDLNELVPSYLSSVPMDWFDGEPMRYDHETHEVFSAWPVDTEGPIPDPGEFPFPRPIQQ